MPYNNKPVKLYIKTTIKTISDDSLRISRIISPVLTTSFSSSLTTGCSESWVNERSASPATVTESPNRPRAA